MLKSKPIGANQKAIANWEASNRMTIEIFLSFWQEVGADLEFPGTQAGEDASYVEWQDVYGKNYGMRKPGGDQKHGIVRAISNDGRFIQEDTYYDDEPHGLCFTWTRGYHSIAFGAAIYDHGEIIASVTWFDDWSEYTSTGNKELILMNNGLSIFKP